MKTSHPVKLGTLLVLLLTSFGVAAQEADLQRAVTAFNAGSYATAVSLWEPHARQGNREAQYAMGVAFYEGKGVSRDLKQALAWFRKAADSGHPTAIFNLGVAYWEGRGVKKNFSQAVDWWERAAELGDTTSQYNLGLAHYLGKGAERDMDKALYWLNRAAEQDHADARRVLGIIGKDDLATQSNSSADTAQPANTTGAQVESATPGQKIIQTRFKAAHVQANDLALRATPDLGKPVMHQLKPGTPVKILQSRGTWVQLELPVPVRLWVFGKYIQGAPNGRVSANQVRLRTHPTTGNDSSVVAHLDKGATVTVYTQSGDWKQISAEPFLQNWAQQSGLAVQHPVTQGWLDNFNALANPGQASVVNAASDTAEAIAAPFRAAWIKTDNTPVIGRPASEAPIISLLDKDIPVKVIGSKDGWIMIKSPTGLDVWVYGKFVKESGDRAEINEDRVRIRSLPSTGTDSDVLGLLDKGAQVQVISRKGDWTRLHVLHSVAGWVESGRATDPGATTPAWQERWDAIRSEATR